MPGLTPKQAKFVDEYLVDLNASAAYVRAGYAARGNAAEVNASRLLRNAQIAAAISSAKSERSKRTQIDADWVLTRLASEAKADLADIYDEAGNLLPIREWPMVWRTGLVVGVESAHEREGSGDDARILLVRKVKLQDRSKTIDQIGKHVDIQAWRERHEHTGKDGGPIQSVSMTPDEFRRIAAEVAAKI